MMASYTYWQTFKEAREHIAFKVSHGGDDMLYYFWTVIESFETLFAGSLDSC